MNLTRHVFLSPELERPGSRLEQLGHRHTHPRPLYEIHGRVRSTCNYDIFVPVDSPPPTMHTLII